MKVQAKKLTDSKWLNLYQRKYDTGLDYYFCSRRKGEKVGTPGHIDAVRALPYFIQEGRIKVVLIENYRYPLQAPVLELPAGIVEEGEDLVVGLKRELEEEIGATLVDIEDSFGGYSTPGMADEYIQSYIVKVKMDKRQNLDADEQITIKLIDVRDIPKVIEEQEFCLQSKLLLTTFYYKHKNS